MSNWRGSSRRNELRKALVDAAEARFGAVFRDPSGADQKRFPILAEAAEDLEPRRWAEGDYNAAVVRSVRRAIGSLPSDEGPTKNFTVSWREIAATLCGFTNADKAENINKPKTYAKYRQVVADSFPHLSRSSFSRHVWEPTFLRLADSFALLKPHAEGATPTDRAAAAQNRPPTTENAAPSAHTEPLQPDERVDHVLTHAQPEFASVTALHSQQRTTPHQYAGARLKKIARKLAFRVSNELAAQERQHHMADNELPVTWTTVHGGRSDSRGHPSTLDGTFPRILETFDKIPADQLVILGRPGSGKTILAARLALDLLDRGPVNGRLIVPTVVNLASWRDRDTDFWSWFEGQLATRYLYNRWKPWQTRRFLCKRAEKLRESGLVMPILEGFDEVDPDLRPNLLEALNEAMGSRYDKVVLTSRMDEYNTAVEQVGRPLTAAPVIQLNDLDPNQVLNDHLIKISGTYTSNWYQFAQEIRTSPSDRSAELLAMLRTPFVVSLAREAYRHKDTDPCELLNTQHVPNDTAINKLLLDRYFESTYKNTCPQRAKRLLGLVANRIKQNGDQDIAWWSLGTPPSQPSSSPMTWLPVIGALLGLVGFAYLPIRIMTAASGNTISAMDIAISLVALGLAIGMLLLARLHAPNDVIARWQKERHTKPEPYRLERYLDDIGHRRGLRRNIAVCFVLFLIAFLTGYLRSTPSPRQLEFWAYLIGSALFALIPGIMHVVNPSRIAPIIQARGWFLLKGGTLRLSSFLHDAYNKGILRRVGRIYQFRHQFLFEYLLAEADQPPRATPHQRDAKPANESSPVDDGSI